MRSMNAANDKRIQITVGFENMNATINWKNDKSSSRRVHLSVRNEYIRIYMYICRMYVRRKLTDHAHRKISMSRTSSGKVPHRETNFLRETEFPVQTNRDPPFPLTRLLHQCIYLMTYLSTIVP